MKIKFEVLAKNQLDKTHRSIFAEMLKKQGKVQGDLSTKADRCKFICIAMVNSDVAAIGAIKEKTASDFTNEKAGIPELSKDIDWELGYLFTEPKHRGRKLASFITRILIRKFGDGNLMASTEISANPGMVKILEQNGFRLYGKPWKSVIHNNYLGLFLKFE